MRDGPRQSTQKKLALPVLSSCNGEFNYQKLVAIKRDMKAHLKSNLIKL